MVKKNRRQKSTHSIVLGMYVSGANTGIGLETAKDLAKRGSRVIMACRSKLRTEPAVQEVKGQSKDYTCS